MISLGGEQLPDTLGKRRRAGRRLVELAVEVVEKPADGLGVCGVRAAYGVVSGAAHCSPGVSTGFIGRQSSLESVSFP